MSIILVHLWGDRAKSAGSTVLDSGTSFSSNLRGGIHEAHRAVWRL